VPNGTVCTTAEEVRTAAEKLITGGASVIVVKSQIHAGGRGKGTFKNGFKGGVKVVKTAADATEAARNMLGQVLVTKQTGPEGRQVTKVLVDPGSNIKKEYYLAILLDRALSRPLIMASAEGGMDIEEVAAKTPERIVKEWIDPAVGIILEVKAGEKVDAGSVLCRLYYTREDRVEEAADMVEDAFRISGQKPDERSLILEVVGV